MSHLPEINDTPRVPGAEGTYNTKDKDLSRLKRGDLLLRLQSLGEKRAFIELGGMLAGVTSRYARHCPDVDFHVVEELLECIASLRQQANLRAHNIRLPDKPVKLEDVLQNFEGKIGFLDADFRGFASPMTLGIANHIPDKCLAPEGTVIWINVYRARGTVADTGLELADIKAINGLLDEEDVPTELTKMAMIAQHAITKKNSKKNHVYEFDPCLSYMGSSKGGEDGASPMFTVCARVYDRSLHPDKEHSYNYEVENLTERYVPRPAVHIKDKEVLSSKRIPGGFTFSDMESMAPVILKHKLRSKEIQAYFDITTQKIGSLKQMLAHVYSDQDWSFLKQRVKPGQITTERHMQMLQEAGWPKETALAQVVQSELTSGGVAPVQEPKTPVSEPDPIKKPRGRPRKHPLPEVTLKTPISCIEEVAFLDSDEDTRKEFRRTNAEELTNRLYNAGVSVTAQKYFPNVSVKIPTHLRTLYNKGTSLTYLTNTMELGKTVCEVEIDGIKTTLSPELYEPLRVLTNPTLALPNNKRGVYRGSRDKGRLFSYYEPESGDLVEFDLIQQRKILATNHRDNNSGIKTEVRGGIDDLVTKFAVKKCVEEGWGGNAKAVIERVEKYRKLLVPDYREAWKQVCNSTGNVKLDTVRSYMGGDFKPCGLIRRDPLSIDLPSVELDMYPREEATARQLNLSAWIQKTIVSVYR